MDQVLKSFGHTENEFRPLQPRIDATSQQIDRGGYELVRQWMISNQRIGLRSLFTKPLFATSPVYDVLLVQIDGDVADLSSDFLSSAFQGQFNSVIERVAALKSWIFSILQAEPAFAGNIIAAIPTLQMEAWILAAIHPTASDLEIRTRKRTAKRLLKKMYTGSPIEQTTQAGIDARQNIARMTAKSVSFDVFAQDLGRRFC
jgi:hypothetical protein